MELIAYVANILNTDRETDMAIFKVLSRFLLCQLFTGQISAEH